MMLSGISFAWMVALVRQIGESGLHPFEIAFMRNVFAVLVLSPIILRHGPAIFRTAHLGLHLARNLLQAFFMLSTFLAVTLIPLAQFTALGYSAPLFAAIGAVLLLKERLEPRRFIVLFIGFAGVIAVLRPGLAEVELGSVLAILSSVAWAGILLLIKRLTRADSSVTITAWFACLMVAFTFPFAVFVWQWPSLEQLFWLATIGAIGTLAHFSLAQAMRATDATAILPLDFLRLVWASLIGYLMFAQIPGIWTWVGGFAIFAASTYLAVSEARAKTAPSAPQTARS
jgi:drug/metabolite transporter (DMT)-like permease